MDILLVAGGLIGLYFGAEWLLRGAVALSRRLEIPALLVSLVVVGFGTSLPELIVSLRAAASGSSDLVVGNVVGSNIANILLIIGIGTVIYPMKDWNGSVKRDALMMLAAAVLMLVLVQFSVIGRATGFAMAAFLAAYLGYTYVKLKAEKADRQLERIEGEELSWPATVGLLIGSLATLFVAAEMLVRGATNLAADFGVSEAVIGLTVVAVGTSLPELATAVVAALNRHSDIAIGNVVGSNIFNILFVLGLTAMVLPVPVAPRFSSFDVPVMVAATVLFATAIFVDRPVRRIFGVILLALYAGYTALVI